MVVCSTPASSFPACGDASSPSARYSPAPVFLPRVRGCFYRADGRCGAQAVPSPRAGMLPLCRLVPACASCSFPACGDASRRLEPGPEGKRFLPRVRGCFGLASAKSWRCRVPSPRAGMLQERAVDMGKAACSFPACGDASCCWRCARQLARFLPRVRGCFGGSPTAYPSRGVPSPRAGMLRVRWGLPIAAPSSFPACGDASAFRWVRAALS